MKTLTVLLSLFCATWALAEPRVPTSDLEIKLSFAPLVKKSAPAVVNIYAKRIVEGRRNPFESDPFFRDLFQGFSQSRPRVQNSLGSGVILSSDGIVVSNNHVVDQASDIRVVLNDGQEFQADVLLADAESDLAVLKISTQEDLPFLTLRNSDTVEVGELVLAIGNPFGVGQTVSSGIVSGLARSGAAVGNSQGYFIQTDAPINPGNSGGALIGMNGQLIGVNTSILSRSGGSNGIGFAIPATLVRQFVRQAEEGRDTFVTPWMGAGGQSVTSDMAKALGLERVSGVILTELHPDSSLKAAGLMNGDVITAIDDAPVNTPAEALYRLKIAGLGQEVRVSYLSQGRAYDVTLTTSEAPTGPPAVILSKNSLLPNLIIQDVSPKLIEDHQLPLGSEGVVVVDPTSTGARLGLRPRDILLEINGRSVTNADDVEDHLRRTRRTGEFVVLRQGRQILLRFRT